MHDDEEGEPGSVTIIAFVETGMRELQNGNGMDEQEEDQPAFLDLMVSWAAFVIPFVRTLFAVDVVVAFPGVLCILLHATLSFCLLASLILA